MFQDDDVDSMSEKAGLKDHPHKGNEGRRNIAISPEGTAGFGQGSKTILIESLRS